MKIIITSKGHKIIVDNEDYDELSQYNWSVNKKGYAYRTRLKRETNSGKPSTIIMHRQIMNAPNGKVVDHINHNTLDNRKENLRICSQKQNSRNCLKQKHTRSNYKGVYRYKGKWRVQITVDGKRMDCGIYDDEIASANAYNYYAKKYHGEFAKLNDVEIVNFSKYKVERETTSKIKGVSYNKRVSLWIAEITYNKKSYHLGYHKTEESAVKARLNKENDLYGCDYAPQRHLFEEYGIGAVNNVR